MSKLTIYLGLLCILCFPLNSPAATKNVTITWSMPDTRNVTGYRMYYAYDKNMTNKSLACETSNTSTTTLTCKDVDFEQSPVYFVIAAVQTDKELSSTSISETFVTGISTVQDFTIAISDDSSSSPSINLPSLPKNKLNWTVSSDNIENPVGKKAVRTGAGKYIVTGCFKNGCYDNISSDNSLKIPITTGDILNQNEFEIEFYFNPQTLSDYGYLLGIGSDDHNHHLVHMFADGRLYCRTTLNGASYFGYILNSDSAMTINTWYKLNYSYSRTSGYIRIAINDELRLEINTTETMRGEATNIYFASDYRGTQRSDFLLDEITIK